VDGLAPLPDFPASERAYKEDGELRVPVRRITVGARGRGRGYDTFGPRAEDLKKGLPSCGSVGRSRHPRADSNFSQMHYARRGEITERCAFLPCARTCRPEFVREDWPAAAPSSPPTGTTPERADDHRRNFLV